MANYLDRTDIVMQIMIYWDNILYLQNIQQLYHLLLIHAHILLILDLFIPHLQIPVEVFQMALILAITGMAHQYLVRFQVPMLFLPWIPIITVGSTILLPFLQPAVELVLLISLQFRLLVKGQLESAQIFQDQDPSCIRSLLATGI